MQKKEQKIKSYKTKSPEKILQMQELRDLVRCMNMNINTFLVLKDEGSIQQIALASQKAKSDLLKHGPDMLRLAQDIEEGLPLLAENYIQSISAILHSALGWIDEAVLHDYFVASQRLAFEIEI